MATSKQKYKTDFVTSQQLKTMKEKDTRPLTIMLLGKTGNGKSSLGNALFDKGSTSSSGDDAPFQVDSGFTSCQEYEPKVAEGTVNKRKLRIVDTPGVMDNISPDEALCGISKAISLCHTGLTAFVIVLRADSKFTKEESEAVEQLQYLFGESFWKYSICVFTHGDNVKDGRPGLERQLSIARSRIPSLDVLLKNVGERVLLVNCKDLTERQRTDFLLLLKGVNSMNDGNNCDSDLFKEAMKCYDNGRLLELIESQRKAKQEKLELEKKIKENLEKENEEMKKKLADLQKTIEEKEKEIVNLQSEVEEALQKLASACVKCVIL